MSIRIFKYAALVFLTSIGLTSQLYAKCAVRTVKQTDGSTASFQAIVPGGKAADFAALGYQDASCSPVEKETYRKKLCPRCFRQRLLAKISPWWAQVHA